MMSYAGIPIVVNALATTIAHRVECMPIKKRRKRYRVRTHRVPAIFKLADKIVMHPVLYEKLKGNTLEHREIHSMYNDIWGVK